MVRIQLKDGFLESFFKILKSVLLVVLFSIHSCAMDELDKNFDVLIKLAFDNFHIPSKKEMILYLSEEEWNAAEHLWNEKNKEDRKPTPLNLLKEAYKRDSDAFKKLDQRVLKEVIRFLKKKFLFPS